MVLEGYYTPIEIFPEIDVPFVTVDTLPQKDLESCGRLHMTPQEYIDFMSLLYKNVPYIVYPVRLGVRCREIMPRWPSQVKLIMLGACDYTIAER